VNSCTLDIEFVDTEPLRQWFGEHAVTGSRSVEAVPGVTLELTNVETGIGFLDSTSATVVVHFASTVASGILARALYDVLQPHVRRLSINKTAVRMSLEKIESALSSVAERLKDKNG